MIAGRAAQRALRRCRIEIGQPDLAAG